jgi:predicted Zn-dependent protease
MAIGNHNTAIVFAYRARQIEPASAGLHANLALAYLLAGRITDAQASIARSLTADQTDKISQTIGAIIQHFATSGRKPPATTPALQDYWRKNRIA